MKKQDSSLKDQGLPKDFPTIEEPTSFLGDEPELLYIGEIETWECLIVTLILALLQDDEAE